MKRLFFFFEIIPACIYGTKVPTQVSIINFFTYGKVIFIYTKFRLSRQNDIKYFNYINYYSILEFHFVRLIQNGVGGSLDIVTVSMIITAGRKS
jgi:hypothetical protein